MKTTAHINEYLDGSESRDLKCRGSKWRLQMTRRPPLVLVPTSRQWTTIQYAFKLSNSCRGSASGKGIVPQHEPVMQISNHRRRLKQSRQPKSALLRILRTIERDGLRKDADQLSNIIARLEDWQNR
jgi:hypothetical protein